MEAGGENPLYNIRCKVVEFDMSIEVGGREWEFLRKRIGRTSRYSMSKCMKKDQGPACTCTLQQRLHVIEKKLKDAKQCVVMDQKAVDSKEDSICTRIRVQSCGKKTEFVGTVPE